MVGKKLRDLRRARHLTQSDVAIHVHCDRSYLSRIENDEVSPPLDLLKALCTFYGTPMDYLVAAPQFQKASGELLVRRCLSLMHQERVAEAQTLAASAWWDYVSGPPNVADELFQVLMAAPNSHPEVLTVILGTMFLRASMGHVDERFFRYGYRFQRILAETGELTTSLIFCNALLALQPGPQDTFRFTLSLGTTLFRLRDIHMASAMYTKARMLWTRDSTRTNLGRTLHGLGACHLELKEVGPTIVLTQDACDLYRDEDPDLYHLALQNLAIAHQLNGEHQPARNYLEQCARHWEDQGNQGYLHDSERLLRDLAPR